MYRVVMPLLAVLSPQAISDRSPAASQIQYGISKPSPESGRVLRLARSGARSQVAGRERRYWRRRGVPWRT